jgi:PilZ domain
MGTFGKAKGGGRRSTARAQAPLLATLSTIANDYRVGLVNLSDNGARLSALDLPAEGEDVMFRAGEVLTFGRVIWSDDRECGVSFETSLTPTEVECLRRQTRIWTLAGHSSNSALSSRRI